MTQEEKELLLKDLLGRIPYSLRFKIGDYSDYTLIGVVISDEHPIKVEVTEKDIVYKIEVSANNVRPYLRPMSSMTEEEWKELNCIGYIVPLYDGCFGVDMRAYLKNNQPHYRRFSEFSTIEDWLNAHYFDYRGLIEKGLALEAPEGMYLY